MRLSLLLIAVLRPFAPKNYYAASCPAGAEYTLAIPSVRPSVRPMRADHVDYVAVALADADRHDNQLYIYTCNYSVPITSQSDAGKISRRVENFISHNRVFNTAP